jgi:glutathione S-transferase
VKTIQQSIEPNWLAHIFRDGQSACMNEKLQLYYSPGACSLAPHIALEEAGAEFDPIRVVLAQGEHLKPEYLAINPHSRVPALGTDRGVITENIAVLNFIADEFSAPGSVPRGDAFAAAKCNELLGWFASSVHIAFAEIWRGVRFTDDESVWPALEAGGRKALAGQFGEIEALCGESWLVHDSFSAADSYALVFFRWGKRIGLDMTHYSDWAALVQRILERPAVQRALAREGLPEADFSST